MLVLTVLALTVAAVGYVYYNSFFEKTEVARVGTNSAPLTAKVGGKVAKVFVRGTQTVKAGEPIAQLDQREHQAALEQRQRELARNEEQIAGGRVYLERLQKKAAETGDEAARKQYEDARAWHGRLQGKTATLRAAVSEAQARLDATTITAPGNGQISKRSIEVGQEVTPGQSIANFAEIGRPWLIAEFRPEQVAKMAVGQRARIEVAGLHHSFEGKVELLPNVPATEPASPWRKLLGLVTPGGGEARVPVRIAFNSESLGRDAARLVNGAAAEVKVYVK